MVDTLAIPWLVLGNSSGKEPAPYGRHTGVRQNALYAPIPYRSAGWARRASAKAQAAEYSVSGKMQAAKYSAAFQALR